MFLKKFSDFIVKHKYIFLAVFAVLMVLAILGTIFLVKDENKINSDMMSYFSEDFDTSKGFTFLKDNFGIRGDVLVVVRGAEDDEQLRESVNKIRNEYEGVNQLVWVEDIDTLVSMKEKIAETDFSGLEIMENPAIKQLMEDENIQKVMPDVKNYVQLMNLDEVEIDEQGLTAYMKRDIGNGQCDYIITMMIEYSPSTEQATNLLNSIKNELTSTNYVVDGKTYTREIASAGMTHTSDALMNETLKELPNFLIYAIVAAIVILLLTSKSFLEPIILVVSLGVSIIISMGVNYLYPSISIISFATCSVLQLAITMDYAVFYMHSYRKNRNKLNPIEATKESIPEVAASITASGFTTIGSFVSLYFMKFNLGADLANVLIKSVLLSIITVLILQPILTLLLDKLIMKTTHDFTGKINKKIKSKKPEFNGISSSTLVRPVARFSVWQRIVLVIIAVALLVPSFLGQSHLKYSYFQMYNYEPNTSEEIIADELGNQLILAVPLHIRNDKTHADLIEEIKADPNNKVVNVVSAFSSIKMDADTMEALLNVITSEKGLTNIEDLLKDLSDKDSQTYSIIKTYLSSMDNPIDLDEYDFSEYSDLNLQDMLKGFDLNMLDSYFAKVGETDKKDGEWYTLYTISITGSAEDESAMKCYEYINGLCDSYFGYNNSYSIGMVTGSYDLEKTTPIDFLLITLISAGIILLIISILLKNPIKGLLLVVLIELGIWINLSFSYLLSEEVNFMVYLIISSVQLGCTVDYAILLANTYERNRGKYEDSKKCAIESASEAIPTIFTSALIIVTVCMAVYFASGNLIIKQLTGMLSRGALISFVLVALLQPALMSFFKANKKKIDYSEKLKEIQENQENLK